jgi:glycosyltransferase involved in cell wall biosynthesis
MKRWFKALALWLAHLSAAVGYGLRSPRLRRLIYLMSLPVVRRAFLGICLKSRSYSLIVDAGGERWASAPRFEASCIGRARAESGMAAAAFEALQPREDELLTDKRCVRNFILVAQRGASPREFVRIAKKALRIDPTQFFLLGDIAAKLRSLRRFGALRRLAATLVWRFEKGDIPLPQFIRIMRAIDRRAPIAALGEHVERSQDRSVRQQFIETLIELMQLDEAVRLKNAWGIPLGAFSASHRRALRHFEVSQASLGVTTLSELEEQTIAKIKRHADEITDALPARAVETGGGAAPIRLLVTASSLGIGGAERQLSLLLNHLATLPDQFEIAVLVMDQRQHEFQIAKSKRLQVVYRSQLTQRFGTAGTLSVPRPLMDDIGLVLRREHIRPLLAFAKQFRPDVIYNAIGLPTEPLLVGALLGVPNIVIRFGGLTFFNDFAGSDRQEINFSIAHRCCQLLADRVSFVTNSKAARDAWADRIGVAADHITVINNGSAFPPLGSTDFGRRSALFGTDEVKVIGFVGRFHNVKRPALWLQIALRLAAQDPTIRFLLVGDGVLRPAIMERTAKSPYHDRFVFTGLAQEELPELYQAMDILLVTSETESFPNVVVEAIGHGAYVVSPPVGDIPSVVNDPRLGRLVDNDDVAGFVDAVTDTLSNLETITEARRYRAELMREQYGIDTMVQAYLKIFQRQGPRTAGEPTTNRKVYAELR